MEDYIYGKLVSIEQVYGYSSEAVRAVLFNICRERHNVEKCLLEIEKSRKNIIDYRDCLLTLKKSGAVIKNGVKIEPDDDWDVIG